MRFVFGPFVLDVDDETLHRNGERVALRGKAFAVLAMLVANAGRLVTRPHLIEEVWAGAAIHPQGLAVCVKELRVLLGDDARAARFIRTEHGRGYRFLAKVRTDEAAAETITHAEGVTAKRRRAITVLWSLGKPLALDLPLIDGAREIGRSSLDPSDPNMSRRHLRITCVAGRWRVEDRGSRNGSWVDGHALTGAAIDAKPGALVRAGETVLLLVDDGAAVPRERALCTLFGDAPRPLGASFVESALLDRAKRTPTAWRRLLARACAGEEPVTSVTFKASSRRSR